MSIVFRQVKGLPLTAEEVDGNFRELLERITKLEESRFVPEVLEKIIQEGDELVLGTNLGKELGRVRIPVIRYMARGEWKTNIAYFSNDFVWNNHGLHVCIQNHQSGENFENDNEYWVPAFGAMKTPSQEDAVEIQERSKITLPVYTKDTLPTPEFASLALLVDRDSIDIIMGDVETWRYARDRQPVNIK